MISFYPQAVEDAMWAVYDGMQPLVDATAFYFYEGEPHVDVSDGDVVGTGDPDDAGD